MTAIELRSLAPDDAGAVQDLLQEQRAEYSRYFRPFAYDAGTIAGALSGATEDVYQGAWYGETLLGVVMLRGWDAGYDTPALGVLVDETFAGTGVADAMIRMALTTARYRGARRVMLHVDVDNARARRCFARHGFTEVSRAGPVLRLEATIVGAAEAETDLRTLYDPDSATIQRGIREAYGLEVNERFARDFAAFAQAKAGELV